MMELGQFILENQVKNCLYNDKNKNDINVVNNMYGQYRLKLPFCLEINGAYKHAISVVGVFFIMIILAVAYLIHRKRSERGKDE